MNETIEIARCADGCGRGLPSSQWMNVEGKKVCTDCAIRRLRLLNAKVEFLEARAKLAELRLVYYAKGESHE